VSDSDKHSSLMDFFTAVKKFCEETADPLVTIFTYFYEEKTN
jgi:hypothetical protein